MYCISHGYVVLGEVRLWGATHVLPDDMGPHFIVPDYVEWCSLAMFAYRGGRKRRNQEARSTSRANSAGTYVLVTGDLRFMIYGSTPTYSFHHSPAPS